MKLKNSSRKTYVSKLKYSPASLKKINEIDVIKSLVSAENMIEVNRKFNLSKASKISEYLETRQLSYDKFRLIQFMAGALPANTKEILATRRLQAHKQFSEGRCSFLKQKKSDLDDAYLNLHQELVNNVESDRAQSFFKKVRFICALDFTHDIEKAAKILSVDIDELKQFIESDDELKGKYIQARKKINPVAFFSKTTHKTATETVEPFPLGRFNFFDSEVWPYGQSSYVDEIHTESGQNIKKN